MGDERVERVLALIETHYVVVERVATLAAAVRARSYAALAGEDFARTLTADLRELSGDAHFKVTWSEVPQAARASATDETPEEIAEFRREARANNFGCAEVRRLEGNVGYWRIDEFYDLVDGAGPTYVAAMRLLAHTDALVVDVRGNSGGDPETVALACSFFFDEPVLLCTFESRDPGRTRQSWTVGHLDSPRYLDRPVFVLVDGRTVSAAEELAYDLQALGRAKVVGERTAGAAHARDRFQVDAHHFVNVPTLRPVSPVTGDLLGGGRGRARRRSRGGAGARACPRARAGVARGPRRGAQVGSESEFESLRGLGVAFTMALVLS